MLIGFGIVTFTVLLVLAAVYGSNVLSEARFKRAVATVNQMTPDEIKAACKLAAEQVAQEEQR